MNKCDCIYDCHCTSNDATGSSTSVQGGGSNYYFIDGIKFYRPLVACPDGGALPLPDYIKPIENTIDANANISDTISSEEGTVSGSGSISSLGKYITFTAIISLSLLNSILYI